MYEPFSDEKATKILKEEELSALALNGMELSIASANNLSDCCSFGVEQAIAYLRDTYLESIDSIGFFEWITKGNEDGKPMIVTKSHFKAMFKEISEINTTLRGMIDDIAILYGQEWWIFGYEDYDIHLATTSYKDDYKKLDIAEVERAMASFSVLLDLNAVTEKRREQFIKRINNASNNLLNDTNDFSNEELFEEVDRLLGMGYYSGFYEEWEIKDK